MVLAGRRSCEPGFVREAGESVGVSGSGYGLLAHGAPWLLGWASAAGSGGRFTRPLSLGTLQAPAVSRRGVGGGCEPAGCASRPGCLYFKTCCSLRARQLWVCSMLLLTAAAVGATQPSAAKMRLGPLPLQCCTGWPGLQ
ncbi:hypothetical protein NN561_002407 [Cricetulus griseus]